MFPVEIDASEERLCLQYILWMRHFKYRFDLFAIRFDSIRINFKSEKVNVLSGKVTFGQFQTEIHFFDPLQSFVQIVNVMIKIVTKGQQRHQGTMSVCPSSYVGMSNPLNGWMRIRNSSFPLEEPCIPIIRRMWGRKCIFCFQGPAGIWKYPENKSRVEKYLCPPSFVQNCWCPGKEIYISNCNFVERSKIRNNSVRTIRFLDQE